MFLKLVLCKNGVFLIINIILFWEMVAFTELHKQDLTVLFIDFEKAYDRVDWDFMEGTLLRMGFPNRWI